MADSHVQASGGTGPNVDAETVTTGDGTVYRPGIFIGDPSTGANRLSVSSFGATRAILYDAAGNPLLVNPSNAQAGTDLLAVAPMLWNGTNFDLRQNNNRTITALSSLARTATTLSGAQVNFNSAALAVFINITANSGAISIFPFVLAVDSLGNTYHLEGANFPNLTAIGSYGYILGAGCSDAVASVLSGYVQNKVAVALPASFKVGVGHNNGNSVTYSVDYQRLAYS